MCCTDALLLWCCPVLQVLRAIAALTDSSGDDLALQYGGKQQQQQPQQLARDALQWVQSGSISSSTCCERPAAAGGRETLFPVQGLGLRV